MTCVTGFPDNPVRCGVSIADFSSGFFMAMSIVSALYHRLKTGEGQTIDLSMQDCMWLLTSIEFAPYYFLNHELPPRLGNGHASMIPCNLYPTKDGDRININAGCSPRCTASTPPWADRTSSIRRSGRTRTSDSTTARKSTTRLRLDEDQDNRKIQES